MNVSELKAILQLILVRVENLQVNQDVLATIVSGSPTHGDLLDTRRVSEMRNREDLRELRKRIEELA